MAADSRALDLSAAVGAPVRPGPGVVRFRAMTRSDLDGVAAIETSAYEFPWSRRSFELCLESGSECRLAVVEGRWPSECENLETDKGERLAGYGILSAVLDEAQLLNICVETNMRGHGHGGALARHMVERAAVRGVKVVFLEVRLSNRIAMTLYDTIGFREVGRRRGYYRAGAGREDAMVMALTLG